MSACAKLELEGMSLCRTFRVLKRSLCIINGRSVNGRLELGQTATTSSYTPTSNVSATSRPIILNYPRLFSPAKEQLDIWDRTLSHHLQSLTITGIHPLTVVTTATAPPTFIGNDVMHI